MAYGKIHPVVTPLLLKDQSIFLITLPEIITVLKWVNFSTQIILRF